MEDFQPTAPELIGDVKEDFRSCLGLAISETSADSVDVLLECILEAAKMDDGFVIAAVSEVGDVTLSSDNFLDDCLLKPEIGPDPGMALPVPVIVGEGRLFSLSLLAVLLLLLPEVVVVVVLNAGTFAFSLLFLLGNAADFLAKKTIKKLVKSSKT